MLPGRAGLQRGTDRPLHTVTIAREALSPGRVWFSLCTSMISPLSRHLIPRCAAPASSRSESESASEPIERVLTYQAAGTLRSVACASSQVVELYILCREFSVLPSVHTSNLEMRPEAGVPRECQARF